MELWLTLILLGTVVFLQVFFLWHIRTERKALTSALAELLMDLEQAEISRSKGLEHDLLNLHEHVDRFHEELQAYLTSVQAREKESEFKIGAFLPQDDHVAVLEKQHALAEDHFISAKHPIRYSSAASRISRPASGQAPSSPRAKPSGRK